VSPENGKNSHFREQLLLDVDTFGKPEDPGAVHVEGGAVTAFSEVGGVYGPELGELLGDQALVVIRVNQRLV
jgi:hypothetical protein